jgi:hypothetical protein
MTEQIFLNDGKPLPVDTLDESLSDYEATAAFNNTLTKKREKVYNAINSERDYQDTLSSDRTDGAKHTVGDYIVMLQHYQQELVKAWTANAGTDEALNVMRKIAGIAVHCMEDHGAPVRVTKTTTHY